ncbi:glycine zipper domain-containing protein [Microbulbifer marinus]|uniref:Osmotically inducible lipoprotein OsmB n=1 Tax=Microbulbifer marinus TaxID=658218 RepID=A0A1H3WYI4_9GAMM|nr:glycine zipper domain-containing protein [Microbulbifer marinus]SDZ92225.1 osmotically inducible lipoprotein OsmB [Microbulbifer marinus]
MRIKSIKSLGLAAFLVAGLTTQGCAHMSDKDRRIGTGAGIGAVTGALITGDAGGAAAGAVIGAGAGWLYDRNNKRYYYYDRHGRRVYR